MAEPSTDNNYTFEDIQRYLQGKMSAAEMHEIEKAALQDSFLADAIEGYHEVSPITAQQHLNEINATLPEEKQNSKVVVIKKNNQWLRIAAIVILLTGVGVIGTYFFRSSNNQKQIAQVKNKQENKQSALKDSVETVIPETLSVNKNSSPVIRENKKKQKNFPYKKDKAGKLYISVDTTNEDEANSVASINVRPEQKAEADKAFAPVPLSAQKNYDSTQYSLKGRISGLNVTAANTFAGKVVDEKNKPVAGVVIADSNKNGVVTDLNGNFILQKKDSLLPVSTTAVGYENKNALLKPNDTNLITLKENTTALNNVVVTGYGTKRKESVNQTATPVGGWQNFNNYVISELNKDSTGKENYISGYDVVELEFLIDNAGNPYDIKITKPLNKERNSKAISILETGPKWTNTSKKKKAKVAIAF